MPEFKYIIDPLTKDKISLFDQKGGTILSDYVKKYKIFREQPEHKEIRKISKIKGKNLLLNPFLNVEEDVDEDVEEGVDQDVDLDVDVVVGGGIGLGEEMF